jgi:hypothetical protein
MFLWGLSGVPLWLQSGQYWHTHVEDTVAISLLLMSGALISTAAVFLYLYPRQCRVFGIMIVLASPLCLLAIGIASPYGGWTHVSLALCIILMLVGLVGGARAIVHAPDDDRRAAAAESA